MTMGNATAPSPKLLAGEEGGKQLVAVKEEGGKGLSVAFEGDKELSKGVLGEGGLPPMPVAVRSKINTPEKYEIDETVGYKNL